MTHSSQWLQDQHMAFLQLAKEWEEQTTAFFQQALVQTQNINTKLALCVTFLKDDYLEGRSTPYTWFKGSKTIDTGSISCYPEAEANPDNESIEVVQELVSLEKSLRQYGILSAQWIACLDRCRTYDGSFTLSEKGLVWDPQHSGQYHETRFSTRQDSLFPSTFPSPRIPLF